MGYVPVTVLVWNSSLGGDHCLKVIGNICGLIKDGFRIEHSLLVPLG